MKKANILMLLSLVFVSYQSVASAYPLPGRFKMKFANIEVFKPSNLNPLAPPLIVAADGIEDNWGVANITDIYDVDAGPLAPAVWTEGTDGEHLRLTYWGLDIKSWTSDPGPFVTTTAAVTDTGVAIPYAGADLWLWDSDLAGYVPLSTAGTPAARIGFSGYPTVSASNAGLQASLTFMPGIVADPTVLTDGTTFGAGIPPTGHGAGYFDVIPGSGPVAGAIDTNTFPTAFGGRDLFFEFNFRAPGVDGFELLSEDPLLGATPEPNTILFFGIGLIGLGAFVRRRIAR